MPVKRELRGRSAYHPGSRRRGAYRRHGARLRRWIFWVSLAGILAVLVYAWWAHRHQPARSKLEDLERMQELFKDRTHADRAR